MVRLSRSILIMWYPWAMVIFLPACGGCQTLGYSDKTVYPEQIRTVSIQAFENKTFYRDIEFDLTSALAKLIETRTPYKIVSDPDRADSVISGQIVQIDQMGTYVDTRTGRVQESDIVVRAVINWKDLASGQVLLNSQPVEALASRILASQDLTYGLRLAVNRLAEQIVQMMEKAW